MTEKLDVVREAIDRELARAAAGSDPVGDDEPEREDYTTRLHSLRDAVAAVDSPPLDD